MKFHFTWTFTHDMSLVPDVFDNLTFDIWHNAGEGFDGEKKGVFENASRGGGCNGTMFLCCGHSVYKWAVFCLGVSKGGCLLH